MKVTLDNFSEMVSKERFDRGMSIREFAKFCGVSHSTIGYIENKERYPSLNTTLIIIDALGKDIEII